MTGALLYIPWYLGLVRGRETVNQSNLSQSALDGQKLCQEDAALWLASEKWISKRGDDSDDDNDDDDDGCDDENDKQKQRQGHSLWFKVLSLIFAYIYFQAFTSLCWTEQNQHN